KSALRDKSFRRSKFDRVSVRRIVHACRGFAVLAALCSGACAPALMKLPEGPGVSATDGAAALAEATRACSAVTTITAEVGVSGSVGGRRFRTRLTAGLAPPASARIEAAAPFGAPLLLLAAVGE